MTKTQWAGLVGGLAVLILFLLLPAMPPVTVLGMRRAGIFLAVIIWWLTAPVGLGVSSLFAIILLVVTDAMAPATAFAYLGDPINWFLLGAFGLAQGLNVTGFARRFALRFMTFGFVRGRPWMMITMMLLAAAIFTAFNSNTVTTVLFMGIAASMFETVNMKKGDELPAMTIMGVAWASDIGCVMTPLGVVTNILMMGWIAKDVGYNISFFQWMLWGIPTGLTIFLVMMLIFRFLVRPDVSAFGPAAEEYALNEYRKMGRMTSPEKWALGIFGLTLLGWFVPDLSRFLAPPALSAALVKFMPLAVPAITGATIMCLIRVQGKPLLNWQQWIEGVEWSAVALVAAVLSLGGAVAAKETGLPELMTNILQPLVGNLPAVLFALVAMIWVVIQTNFMSNLVSMTIVYTVMASMARLLHIGNPQALGVLIVAGSNQAFALPPATTVTAIVTGSGWVPVGLMAKYGFILAIITAVLYAFIFYPLASVIFA